MSLVSVVVPVYNAEKTIDRCVESVINQTYSEWEVILVDDGSIDNSYFICKKYADRNSKIKVVRQQNGGVSRARNTGIKEAKGTWIMFLDSDDWLKPEAIQVLVELLKASKADLGVCGMIFEYEKEKKQYHISDNTYLPSMLYTKTDITGIDAILCSPCNKLYKKSIISENNIIFSENVKFGEDFIFNTQVIPLCKSISCLNSPLYHYDCTAEETGVKKLYREYDVYIRKMEQALSELSTKIGLDSSLMESFGVPFIAKRWIYATEICTKCKLSNKEKAKILCEWYSKIDYAILAYISQQQGACSVYAMNIMEKGCVSPELISRVMKKEQRKDKVRREIVKAKQIFRKVIK